MRPEEMVRRLRAAAANPPTMATTRPFVDRSMSHASAEVARTSGQRLSHYTMQNARGGLDVTAGTTAAPRIGPTVRTRVDPTRAVGRHLREGLERGRPDLVREAGNRLRGSA